MDQLEMSQPGIVPQTKGKLTNQKIIGTQNTIDHLSTLIHVHLMQDLTLESTISGKESLESFCQDCDVTLKKIRADNGRFADTDFMNHVHLRRQSIELCGVGAHHQNSVAERMNRTLTEKSQTILLHAKRLWPEAISVALWPLAILYAAYLYNYFSFDNDRLAPIEKFCKTKSHTNVFNIHPWGCPVYILDEKLQNGQKIPRWEP